MPYRLAERYAPRRQTDDFFGTGGASPHCATPLCFPRSARAAQAIEPARRDPYCPRPGSRRLRRQAPSPTGRGRKLDERLRTSPVDASIIVTKSGNLKVLECPTALLVPNCDLGTTLNKTMGWVRGAHKLGRWSACQPRILCERSTSRERRDRASRCPRIAALGALATSESLARTLSWRSSICYRQRAGFRAGDGR